MGRCRIDWLGGWYPVFMGERLVAVDG
ncbi:MAG: hypothetical protein QOK02_4388, partial [Mycobacterium sp.]|nr:hypothetical protein [Mycobacterium sp.]